MQDDGERLIDTPHAADVSDPLVSSILAQVGLRWSAAFSGMQEREAAAALSNPAWPVRVAAVQALAERGKRAPVELLVAALRDRHESVRAAAARALGKLGKRALVAPLVAALNDPRWRVRTAAALALGNLRQRTPVEPLLACLNDRDASVRAAAVWALGRLGKRAPVGPLAAALQDSAWPVREAAALALRELGQRAPVVPLLAAHQMDQDSQVREAIGWALETRFSAQPGFFHERNAGMQQRVDFDEQHEYQPPYGYESGLYQGQQVQPGNRAGLFGLGFVQPAMSEPTPPRHRLIVAICSLVALLVAVFITLIAATESQYYQSSIIAVALIALSMVCATIVAINLAFRQRR